MTPLERPVAVISGSSSGIGRAVALGLARSRQARLVVNCSSSEEQARKVCAEVEQAGGEAELVVGDVSRAEVGDALVQAAVRRWGRLDVLVNNAGTTEVVPMRDLEAVLEEDWDRIFGVNVKGAFLLTRAALTHLRDARGSVVNISSIAGMNAGGSSLAYSASKAALNNLTLNLAAALAPEVRVNAVAPGFVDSPWIERYFQEQADKVRGRVSRRTPTGRLTTPEDVAEVVLHLINGMPQTTGQILVVDGGYTVG